ncbi:hypothetical protein LXL04_008911 [Taraxacum kok-saghyz]
MLHPQACSQSADQLHPQQGLIRRHRHVASATGSCPQTCCFRKMVLPVDLRLSQPIPIRSHGFFTKQTLMNSPTIVLTLSKLMQSQDTCGIEHVGLPVLRLEIYTAGKYMASSCLIKACIMMTEREVSSVCLTVTTAQSPTPEPSRHHQSALNPATQHLRVEANEFIPDVEPRPSDSSSFNC